MSNDLIPLDVFKLTELHLKMGEPCQTSDCPIALMLQLQSEYKGIGIDREDIEYTHNDKYYTKKTSWLLLGFIHTIDHPDIPIRVRNRKTEEIEHLFGGEKKLQPPYRIEEFDDWFNLHLDKYPLAHLDAFKVATYIKDEKLIHLTIHITRFESFDKDRENHLNAIKGAL